MYLFDGQGLVTKKKYIFYSLYYAGYNLKLNFCFQMILYKEFAGKAHVPPTRFSSSVHLQNKLIQKIYSFIRSTS